MKENIYQPTQELKNIVKQYFVVSQYKDIEKLLFLPNGGNFLVFNKDLSCYTKQSDTQLYEVPKKFSVSIKRNKAKQIIIDTQTEPDSIVFPIILVELTPIGFYKLFNQDASILISGYLEISDEITEKYFDKIYSHKSIKDEINYLNSSLIQMEAANNNTHLVVEDIIDSIIHKHYLEVTVEELMKEFQYTRKTMERQFKKTIGFTPKNFIYILKFCKSFLEYVEKTKSLKDIEYLYSDNAHFNVVFQNITGYRPSELFSAVKNDKIKIYQISYTL